MQLLRTTLTDETLNTFLTISNDLNVIYGMIGLDRPGKASRYIKQAKNNLENLLSPKSDLQNAIESGNFSRDIYLKLRETLMNLDLLHSEDEPSQTWFSEKVHKPFMEAFQAVAPEIAANANLKA